MPRDSLSHPRPIVRRHLALALSMAGLLFVAAAPPPVAAGGNAVAKARRQSVSDFKSAARTAEKTFFGGVSGLTRGLNSGATDAETAASTFGDALGVYTGALKAAADDAAEAAATAISDVMIDAGDDDLDAAQAGDFGQLDGYFADVEKELERLRKRATKKARGFTRVIKRRGGTFVRMRVALSPWTPDRLTVPTAGGPDPTGERPIRLYGTVATHLDDGRVIVSAFGSADRAVHQEFDVRVAGVPQLAVGEFLSAGGVSVSLDGTWRVTGDVGTPLAGNRALLFGTEPEDAGLAGLQPTRLVQAGVISIP